MRDGQRSFLYNGSAHLSVSREFDYEQTSFVFELFQLELVCLNLVLGYIQESFFFYNLKAWHQPL